MCFKSISFLRGLFIAQLSPCSAYLCSVHFGLVKQASYGGFLLVPAVSRWMEKLALAAAIRRAGQIQAAWRGHIARTWFGKLDSIHRMEEEALKGERVKSVRVNSRFGLSLWRAFP